MVIGSRELGKIERYLVPEKEIDKEACKTLYEEFLQCVPQVTSPSEESV